MTSIHLTVSNSVRVFVCVAGGSVRACVAHICMHVCEKAVHVLSESEVSQDIYKRMRKCAGRCMCVHAHICTLACTVRARKPFWALSCVHRACMQTLLGAVLVGALNPCLHACRTQLATAGRRR